MERKIGSKCGEEIGLEMRMKVEPDHFILEKKEGASVIFCFIVFYSVPSTGDEMTHKTGFNRKGGSIQRMDEWGITKRETGQKEGAWIFLFEFSERRSLL